MKFKYVWGLLYISGSPPTTEKLHQRVDCQFYPFDHSGAVLTIDHDVWDIPKLDDKPYIRSKISYWPSATEIDNFINGEDEKDHWRLIALSDQDSAPTIDPENFVKLEEVSLSSMDSFFSGFSEAGFDVIDTSGLSALTNIGYSKIDLIQIEKQHLAINSYGLIKKLGDSYKFAECVSDIAQEHTPFFPVKIWVKKPLNT